MSEHLLDMVTWTVFLSDIASLVFAVICMGLTGYEPDNSIPSKLEMFFMSLSVFLSFGMLILLIVRVIFLS